MKIKKNLLYIQRFHSVSPLIIQILYSVLIILSHLISYLPKNLSPYKKNSLFLVSLSGRWVNRWNPNEKMEQPNHVLLNVWTDSFKWNRLISGGNSFNNCRNEIMKIWKWTEIKKLKNEEKEIKTNEAIKQLIDEK